MELNDTFVSAVQKTIQEYIDSVGISKVASRTLEKLEYKHKALLDDFYSKFKPYFKINKDIKNEVQSLKKKKIEKGASKAEKIEFNNQQLAELVGIANKFEILPDLKSIHQLLLRDVQRIKNWTIYEQWIDWALEFGDGSYLATHIAKLTHSSSKGSSIDFRYFETCKKYSRKYLTTKHELESLDAAYPDNKYSSITQLYNIEVEGCFIGDLLREDGRRYLCHLTDDLELLNVWNDSFSKKIKDENKKSYFLSKQVYFPIANDDYHLLLPLISSSLAHELHLEHKKRWDEPFKTAFEQKSNKKYSDQVVATYPNKASLHVTGSNHSNSSSLNGKRGGRILLMAALPPQWNAKLPSYSEYQSIFTRSLAYELWDEISELSRYLLLLKNKELSVSEPKRNAAVLAKLSAINDQFFNFIDSINNSESGIGWSLTSKLDIEYQILFEPWRVDDAALSLKKNNDWLNKISQDFGRWLNQQLNKDKQLKLTPIQAALWADCFFLDLKEFFAIKEVEL
ncbi:type I-F CRISPR-associated protein Csy1 [Salinivibrio costicola]|uniref:Type I-F CRISPR-associated protein Csy1 n=1 Tax=Salinivibrio costicola subsp. alcaliphilus TaxID=272773 RepID=A0ABX3KNJ4_SALCS|nr:type I-F CRISPR-associated protein Csy1 [Salinivibrio costicola]OOF32726.1 type I-F CRISPR-associated protein Csy1 [Salinivibrio costicola subsp. alcaliphilus]